MYLEKLMKKMLPAFMVMSGILLSACSMIAEPPHYTSEHDVSHAHAPRPKWTDPATFEKIRKDTLHFTGVADRISDMEEGRKESSRMAIESIRTSIASQIVQEIDKAIKSNPVALSGIDPVRTKKTLEKYVDAERTEAFSGIYDTQYWWRKYWIQTSPAATVRYYYQVFCLVEMSRENFRSSVRHEIDGIQRAVRDRQARRVLQLLGKAASGDPGRN